MDDVVRAMLEGRPRAASEQGFDMRRFARFVGLVLVALGALLVLQGLHIVPGQFLRGPWSLGWGAWGVMFGAFFIVWGFGAGRPRSNRP